MKKLREVLNLEYGKGLIKGDRIEGEYPVYRSSGIIGYHNEFIVKAPNVVVGRKGNVGSVFLVKKDFYPIDTTYYVKSNLNTYYVFHLLSNQKFLNNDAAVPGLNRTAAHSIQFIFPVASLITEFGNVIKSFYSQIENLNSKSNNLRRTRDLLLPKLMSGEVEV